MPESVRGLSKFLSLKVLLVDFEPIPVGIRTVLYVVCRGSRSVAAGHCFDPFDRTGRTQRIRWVRHDG